MRFELEDYLSTYSVFNYFTLHAIFSYIEAALYRCSYEKCPLKIRNKFTGEQSCPSVISINLRSNFIEITLRSGCSPINFLHIFRTPSYKNTFGGLLLPINKLLYKYNQSFSLQNPSSRSFIFATCKF